MTKNKLDKNKTAWIVCTLQTGSGSFSILSDTPSCYRRADDRQRLALCGKQRCGQQQNERVGGEQKAFVFHQKVNQDHRQKQSLACAVVLAQPPHQQQKMTPITTAPAHPCSSGWQGKSYQWRGARLHQWQGHPKGNGLGHGIVVPAGYPVLLRVVEGIPPEHMVPDLEPAGKQAVQFVQQRGGGG